MSFQACKKFIFTNIALFWLLHSLNIVYIEFRWYFDQYLGPSHILQTSFTSMNQYFNGKLSFFLTEVSFDTSEEKQLSYFQKWRFKKKSFMILWPYNEEKCRWKNKIISELFTINNLDFRIVTFLPGQSLLLQNCQLFFYACR